MQEIRRALTNKTKDASNAQALSCINHAQHWQCAHALYPSTYIPAISIAISLSHSVCLTWGQGCGSGRAWRAERIRRPIRPCPATHAQVTSKPSTYVAVLAYSMPSMCKRGVAALQYLRLQSGSVSTSKHALCFLGSDGLQAGPYRWCRTILESRAARCTPRHLPRRPCAPKCHGSLGPMAKQRGLTGYVLFEFKTVS